MAGSCGGFGTAVSGTFYLAMSVLIRRSHLSLFYVSEACTAYSLSRLSKGDEAEEQEEENLLQSFCAQIPLLFLGLARMFFGRSMEVNLAFQISFHPTSTN